MALNETDKQEVQMIAELEVRQYFDHYLTEIFPKQLAVTLEAHDQNCGAHGSITKRFERFKWMLIGLAAGGGISGGYGLSKLLSLL